MQSTLCKREMPAMYVEEMNEEIDDEDEHRQGDKGRNAVISLLRNSWTVRGVSGSTFPRV